MSYRPNYNPRNCCKFADDAETEPYFRVLTNCKGRVFVVTKRYTRRYKDGKTATRWSGFSVELNGAKTTRDWDKRSVKTEFPITIHKKKYP